MPSTNPLTPKDHAAFAVASRLLSCLVTEQVLLAFHIPSHELGKTAGVMAVLSPKFVSNPERIIKADDLFALVLLHHPPVFLNGVETSAGRRIGLVDPLDMLPEIYELHQGANGRSVCVSLLPYSVNSCILNVFRSS
jgi:hypothetical protein